MLLAPVQRARGVDHERKTARTARSSCSAGSCGKGRPAWSAITCFSAVQARSIAAAGSSSGVPTPHSAYSVDTRRLQQVVRYVENGARVHLQQPPVGVPREVLVARVLRQPVDRLVGQPDVEDGLHHPGHRELRTGAHRDQQRVGRVTQPTAHRPLQPAEVRCDLVGQSGRQVAGLQIGTARRGRDRESRWNREPQPGHLREIGALPPEQVLLVHAPLGEVEHVAVGRRHCGHVCATSLPHTPAPVAAATGPKVPPGPNPRSIPRSRRRPAPDNLVVVQEKTLDRHRTPLAGWSASRQGPSSHAVGWYSAQRPGRFQHR